MNRMTLVASCLIEALELPGFRCSVDFDHNACFFGEATSLMGPLLAVLCASVVAVSLLGGALPLATVLTHVRLQLYLSFAAGAMLGAAFLHMMPEAVELGSAATLRWVIVGLLTLFFVERFFSFHRHEAPANPGEPRPIHPARHERHGNGGQSVALADLPALENAESTIQGASLHWGAAAFGLAIHTWTGGVALASAVAAEGRVGPAVWGVFVATLVHKPADALTIVSLMLRAGVPRLRAHLVNLGFASMIPAGAAFFWFVLRQSGSEAPLITARCLAFSAGTFLCIALSDLLPELQFHSHDRWKLSVALLLGVGLMALAGGIEG